MFSIESSLAVTVTTSFSISSAMGLVWLKSLYLKGKWYSRSRIVLISSFSKSVLYFGPIFGTAVTGEFRFIKAILAVGV